MIKKPVLYYSFLTIIILSSIISLLLIKTKITSKQVNQITKTAAQGNIIEDDDFERTNVFQNPFWQIQTSPEDSASEQNFSTTPYIADAPETQSISGQRVLQIENHNQGLEAIRHFLSTPLTKGIIKIAFYDYGDSRSVGSVFSITNKQYIENKNSQTARYLIFQVDNKNTYTYRLKISGTEEKIIDSGITRTRGWHTLEFRLEPCGFAYGVIDNQSLYHLRIFDFQNIYTVNLGRVWRGFEGKTYFDKFEVRNFLVPNYLSDHSKIEILDHWSDIVYQRYKTINYQPLIDQIPNIDGGHSKTMRARALADQAMMYLYYYYTRCEINPGKPNCDPDDLKKAKEIIKGIANKYQYWGKVWLSPTSMNLLLFDAWFAWKDLDFETKEKIKNIVAEEANFWTWVLEEIKRNPNGQTIPQEAGRRENQGNISLITTNPNTNDHLYDTRAEETGQIAQFLAYAYNLFPEHPEANKWNEAAKCFAFHTISKGETYCGITTRTVSDDYTLGNHNLYPNPGYSLAAVTELQQGQWAYLLQGKPVPQEFKHGLENEINSYFWQRNLKTCGCETNSCFTITEDCHRSKDWGDQDFLISAMMLDFWQSGQSLFNDLLNYAYYSRPNLIKSKMSNMDENLPLNQTPSHWWRNLEVHVQESAKVWLNHNYQNRNFRSKYFPYQLWETIDILSYFLPQEGKEVELCHDNGQGGCDNTPGVGEYLSNLRIGNSYFKTKWRNPKTYEYYTWDNNFIYLKYNGTWEKSAYGCNYQSHQYSFTNGKFAKRYMTVGEKILVNDNEIIMYKDDCTVCDRKPNHYVITLESHQPQLDLGGQLGKQDTIVLKYTYGTDPNGKNYEKFFLAKGWGHVRWQQFENDVLKYDIILNKISGNNPVFPSGGCAGPLPCSSINLPTNLKAQCSPDKTKVTLSWNYAPGASFYSLRVDNFTTGGWDNSCQASAGDFCKDTVDTKFTLFINPTHQYHWWLHSRNSCQQWSERVSGPDFNCNQNSPTPTTSSIPGDINHDGKVDSFDYIIFLSKYGSNDPNCDFNNNGIVDLADYTILLFNYKQ